MILSPPDTLNEAKGLLVELDNAIGFSISNQKKIELEQLVRIPSRIWYKMHMAGDKDDDNKW